MVGFLSYASEYLELSVCQLESDYLSLHNPRFGSFLSLTQMRPDSLALSLPPCEAVGH